MKTYKIELNEVELKALLLCVAFTGCKCETELSQVARGLYRIIDKQTNE